MTREVEARLKISAVDRTGAVLKNIGNKLTAVNQRVSALNRAQNDAMMMMGRFLGPAALAYGIKESVTQFAELERRMTRIGITAGVTREQTQAATETLRRMASDLAMPFDDVVKGLDTLVSSGLSLQEAMAFLPSVLKTAQATGSATEDIANTALKASSALKIAASDMDRAFDIMVAGGKAGQFELKDMAQYIPGLANSFATLGYEGEDGLKKLIAVLQTIREDTGDASAAATQAQNIFGKMYSEETANKFKKFGIDLRKEMETAKAAGKDALTAFVDLSKAAIKGDLSKLPLLFSDQEFRLGMQSLITSPESLKKFLDLLNNSNVEGTVLRDLGTVLDDTQSKIDKLKISWDGFVNKLGEAASGIVAPGLDAATGFLDDRLAEEAGLKKFRQGNPELEDNTIDEFYRRARKLKLAEEGILGNITVHGLMQRAFQSLGRGETSGLLEFLDRESQKTDSLGKLRAQYEQYRPGRGPENVLGADSASGKTPVPVVRPTRDDMALDRLLRNYREGGHVAASGKPDTEAYGPASALNAALGDPNADRAVRGAIRRKQMLPFDRRRATLQETKDAEPVKPFSLRDAMKMDLDVGVFREAGDQIKQGAAEGGQALGDEATRRLSAEMATLGQQLGEAAAAAIREAVGKLERNPETDARDAPADRPLSPVGGGDLDDFAARVKEGLSQGAADGGQKISQGGDEAGRALIDAGRQFAQTITAAAAQAAQALANVKVNVNTTATQPNVNANTGKTNTFARAPGTGRQ